MTIPPETQPSDQPVTAGPIRAAAISLEKLVVIETEKRLAEDSTHIYEEILERVESAIIATVMKETNHNLTHAARLLGISRPTLRSKIRMRMPYKE